MRLLASHRTYAVVAILVLSVIVFLNGLGTFHTDIKPEIYMRPWSMLVHYLSSWTSSPYLGSPNFNVGLVPVLAVLSGLRGIGMSPEFAFKTFHLILLLIAAFGAARLVRTLVPQASGWLALAAAVFYVANPYTISAGATLAFALPMAFLPWMLICVAQAYKRPRSWAWPALVGISFFLMSGMNVAVVPLFSLLAIIPLTIAVWHDTGLTVKNATIVLSRSALFVVLFSLYWLVPAFLALGTGAQIVDGSETMDGIAKVSSLPEVLRGLGLWPLYGSSSIGPWVPEHAVYLTSPFVVVVTMLWPTLGLVGLLWATTRLRLFIALSVALSAVIMVGLFPNEASPASPFGIVLREVLSIPALSAFRTTNKIGAVLALALAFGVAALAVYWLPKIWQFAPARITALVLVVTLFAGWTMPAFTGGLYTSALDLPEYWDDAAASIDKSEQPGTVLVLPGQVRANYRWTEERPDDVLNSILDRRAVLPETTPNASPPAVNFLAALDSSFQSGTSAATVVSGMARYLGAGQVLLRHDVVWENNGGARPAQTSQQVGSDHGLFGRENFGNNGQNVLSPAMEDPFFFGEQFLPPLQVYDVQGPQKPVRALPLDRGLIVAGDGFAFPQMLSENMLGSTPLVRYAQDVSAKSFADAISQSERMVLTDTNARRNVIPNRLTAGFGQLLTAKQPLGATRTLGTNKHDQTVREDEVISVKTSQSGGVFFDLPYGAGQFAFDGDLATSWRFGDFGTAKGQTIKARFAKPTKVSKVAIAQMKVGDAVIDEVEVTVGKKTKRVSLPENGIKEVPFKNVTTRDLTIKVKSIAGEGFNFVAISEINVNGLRSEPVARMPLTFDDRWESLDAEGRAVFSKTPLDVLMTRVQNTVSTADDSETVLDRRFSLPDDREFEISGDVRILGAVEPIYDRLEGRGEKVKATSSGFYFDDPEVRASRAADGKADTSWIPGGGTRNAWWQVETTYRSIDGVTIVQDRQNVPKTTADQHHTATRVQVLVDDRVVATSDIGLGRTRIDFDEPVSGSKVRVRIIGLDGDPKTYPPAFSVIDTGVQLPSASKQASKCVEVATIDGNALLMKPASDTLASQNQQGTLWEACDSVAVKSGAHRLTQSPDFMIDRLALRDTLVSKQQVRAAPIAQVLKDGNTHKTIRVQGSRAGYAVVAGQGVNTNWRARVNGKDIGAAQTLNGYSSGWILPEGEAAVIDMEYIPQRWSYAALGISGLALFVSLLMIALSVARKELFAAGNSTAAETFTRPTWLTRPVAEGLFVVGAGLLGGLAGLVAAGIFILGERRRGYEARTWVFAGCALVFVSILTYLGVVVANDLVGKVSADAVSMSMWPHYIAVAGLVWILAGILGKFRK